MAPLRALRGQIMPTTLLFALLPKKIFFQTYLGPAILRCFGYIFNYNVQFW